MEYHLLFTFGKWMQITIAAKLWCPIVEPDCPNTNRGFPSNNLTNTFTYADIFMRAPAVIPQGLSKQIPL
ncbi:hypothetical protein CLH39_03725 [Alcaligenes faecalis]|nr:hypothetical protein D0C27_06580 [Alcaligenes faecalis]QRF89389.1 hypothetical protein CLH39_03725 [Alcaligenes faecalis]